MGNNFVFSWAEDAQGKMVHVDDVPRGLACGCGCPCCHEKLLARHGDVKEHGFAHHSDNRGANLNICYMVILYKLAEQIIQTRKKIHAPSYYGIFKEKDIEFADVKIDGRYEREDKQPDVIATTKDNQQYIIEFTFDYKVQHKQALDYKNLNCLEINLSNQTLESVEKFLLEDNTDRIWFNNQEYFDSIEPRYEMANKRIKVKNEDECKMCELYYSCVGVRAKESGSILVIENSGKRYRICKLEQYDVAIEDKHNRLKEAEDRRNAYNQESSYSMYKRRYREFLDATEENTRPWEKQRLTEDLQAQLDASRIPPSERTCFMCKRNLTWWNRNDGIAHCGAYYSMGVPKKTPPDTAIMCKGFMPK